MRGETGRAILARPSVVAQVKPSAYAIAWVRPFQLRQATWRKVCMLACIPSPNSEGLPSTSRWRRFAHRNVRSSIAH